MFADVLSRLDVGRRARGHRRAVSDSIFSEIVEVVHEESDHGCVSCKDAQSLEAESVQVVVDLNNLACVM